MTGLNPNRNRRPYRTCQHCGSPAPLDAIRLRGGARYCAEGECRRVAEECIKAARDARRLRVPGLDKELSAS